MNIGAIVKTNAMGMEKNHDPRIFIRRGDGYVFGQFGFEGVGCEKMFELFSVKTGERLL